MFLSFLQACWGPKRGLKYVARIEIYVSSEFVHRVSTNVLLTNSCGDFHTGGFKSDVTATGFCSASTSKVLHSVAPRQTLAGTVAAMPRLTVVIHYRVATREPKLLHGSIFFLR